MCAQKTAASDQVTCKPRHQIESHSNLPQKYISFAVTQADFTVGALQNIGFKELYPYLLARYTAARAAGQEEETAGGDMEMLLAECIENMKRATRKYVR